MFGGKTSRLIGVADTVSAAPPRPWIKRAAVSSKSVCEREHASDASTKKTSPMRNMRQ
jgi:hypothetical protein